MTSRRLSREEALARAAAATPPGICAMCHLVATGAPLIRGRFAALHLTALPVRWGHLLVVLGRHVTRFGDLGDDEHAEATALALRAARALERALEPARVYVASLGTSAEGLPMTSPHLHWHVVPVAGPDERPSEVLSWAAGVVEASEDAWVELRGRLDAALAGA